MRKLLLSVFFLLLSSTFLYADMYFFERHISTNKYYDTLGYGVGELLESKKCPNCVHYDINDVKGVSSEYILQNVDIYDVTTYDSRYGLIRTPLMYDRVSLPPYSSLDFIYWSLNSAQKDVNITSLYVFLSRSVPTYGDLTKVLNIDGEYKEIPITYIIYNYPRMGMAKEYPGVGVVSANGGIVNGNILDRVYVKTPLEFVKWEVSVDGEYAFVNITVKNTSEWELRNIVFNHFDYTNSRTFLPNEQYIYEYVVDVSSLENNLGYASLYNPNTQTQCGVLGENLESNYVGDSPAIAGLREENGDFLEYIGSRVKPLKESFCVTQIPYTLYSGEIVLANDEQENEDEGIMEEEEVVDIGEVLGIEKLPQTGIKRNRLLVVVSRLWYYLTRRFVK